MYSTTYKAIWKEGSNCLGMWKAVIATLMTLILTGRPGAMAHTCPPVLWEAQAGGKIKNKKKARDAAQ